ncbi:ATP-binding protein [Calidifontibacillus oryziterrae]|uniref:ATP-binding protein n=1 Tax=Calidifontibacillus oryziterrae TaxID=1191699 RepID=UPI0002D68033|nr:ATP-binding protein [Calidifontibacillus oryziterrae]
MKQGEGQQCLLVEKEDDIFQAMDVTERIAGELGFLKDDKLYLRLATEEACMNAYEYCKKTKQVGFEIWWNTNRDMLSIYLKHKGKKFNVHVNNDEINVGLRGRGLQLIVNLMDHVGVEENGDYVQFSMRKYVNNKRQHEGNGIL